MATRKKRNGTLYTQTRKILKTNPTIGYKDLAYELGITNKEAAYILKQVDGRGPQHDFKKSLAYQIEVEARKYG